MAEALATALADTFDGRVQLRSARLLAGGASKEAWAVDIFLDDAPLELLVRRATGGAIFSDMLSLAQEFHVLERAYEAGVTVPKPYGYIDDINGRAAFVMERVRGETIGRRIVQKAEFATARDVLPAQMAVELARIHAIPVDQVATHVNRADEPFAQAYLNRLEAQLDSLGEPFPAIELGLAWLRGHAPNDAHPVLIHGDFRLGNLVVDGQGLRAVLDWEFAAMGTAAADVAWPLVRAWRFGTDDRRLAGIGEVEPYLARYNDLSEHEVSLDELSYWELSGNVRWAIGALTQARRHLSGAEPSVELALLGRVAAEMEFEILHLLEAVS